jgi:HlyD family secretion protein
MFVCAIPLISALFAGCTPAPPFATGYVEGDYVLIAPVSVAQISGLSVQRGDHVKAGQVLVDMERQDAEIALAEAEAAKSRAESQLANLHEGKRPEEIGVIQATLASARAQAEEAKRNAERISSLTAKGAATQAQKDDAATVLTTAEAKIAEVEAGLAVAQLPARPQEIAAAEATLRGAEADLARAHWSLEKRQLSAPTDGVISDVIRNPGEIAGPSAPVLSLLPDGGEKLRLYVPEALISQIKIGGALQVNCDACPQGLTATVSYVADGPEFTPPVIYSLQNRQKLVFLIEARPDDAAAAVLKPGQIVDVDLSGLQQ